MKPLHFSTGLVKGLGLMGLLLVLSCKQASAPSNPKTADLQQDIENELNELIRAWYPKTMDSVNGGFWSDFDHQWQKKGRQDKFLVSQARHVWTTATLARFFHDDSYAEMAAHGYRFLRDRMWDKEQGGFHSLLVFEGDSLQVGSKGKSAYGNSFAIYGLATYFKATKDTSALNLAKKTFAWLEQHAHDPVYGGYFDVLQRDGSWMLDIEENTKNHENFIRKDWKDQNSSIHLLESFTALYEVWPDALLRKRLEELLVLIRDTITTDKGYLTLHLERDWTPGFLPRFFGNLSQKAFLPRPRVLWP